MIEIWKNIEGYPNYMVSNMGRVKSLVYGKEKIMKLRYDSDGYLLVNFRKNKKPITFKVHRLVAQAFIPNPDNKPCIDHINCVRSDNRVENLRWVTHKENCNNQITKKKHSGENCYMYGRKGLNHPSSIPIIQFTKNGEFVRKWDNAQDVAREWGLYSGSNILSCCNSKLKTAYGYKWGYIDDYEKIPFKVFDLVMYRKKAA